MQWSFSTLGCPDLTLHQSMDLAQKYAVKTIELRILSGSLDLPLVLDSELGHFAREGRKPMILSLPVAALNTSCQLFDPSERNRSALVKLVPWAEALQVPYIRVFDGPCHPEGPSSGDLDKAGRFVSWWRDLRIRKGWNVDILVETHESLLTSVGIKRLQSAFGRNPVAVLWDSHHTWRKGGECPLETWREIRNWVRHIHFKDSRSEASGKLPYTFTLPGMGEMPLTKLFQQLHADGYGGPVSLEWEKYWHPEQDMPSLEAALKQCRENGWW